MPTCRLAFALGLVLTASAHAEDERVDVRDIKIDGRPCQQNATYHANGKRSSLLVTCNGKREGSYGRYDERGKPVIEGGYVADAPAGTWTFRGPDGRLAHRIIFTDGHASQRVPPLLASQDGALELYAAEKPASLRLEVDGKLTTIGKTRVESFLEEAAWTEIQTQLAKAWTALETSKPSSPPSSETERREIAIRRGKSVQRLVCGKTCPPALEAVRAFATAQLAAAAAGEGALGILGVATADSPGSLDFPPSGR